jgi:hypothetical protein
MGDDISHPKTQTILNIIKMEDLHDTQDYMAKHNKPSLNPNPKGMRLR